MLQVLEDEYGRPVDEIFDHIDATPLGSASLAQVHRAKLTSGEDVAIKVQRPGVRETMAQDVSIMRSIAKVATRTMHSAQVVDLSGVVEELWDTFESGGSEEPERIQPFLRTVQVHGLPEAIH